MGKPILEIKNLRKVFNKDLLKKAFVAVDDITCSFEAGQCTGLMGHNGAGKTTTIRSIFGLVRPDKGEILFEGKAITQKEKKLIGYMPEINKLPLNLTPEEILSYQLHIFDIKAIKRKHHRDLIKEKLEQVELWKHKNKKVKELSKGMARRLAWAQATIHKPELIILDEPFSGLDPLGRQLLNHLINGMRIEKTSIILCTHELGSASELADKLYILNRGKLVYSSSEHPDQIDKTPDFELTIAGCSSEYLDQVATKFKLPEWSFRDEHGYHQKLWFKDYTYACAWMKACVDDGIIITNFSKSHQFNESQLITFFSEAKGA
jgi:ABC-2 type transport system ATP-binding protein